MYVGHTGRGYRSEQSQAEWIENDLGHLEQFEKIIVWMDDDDAGHVTAREIAHRLGIERCRLAFASHDCNDPNEMLQKGCEEADFIACLDAAKPGEREKVKRQIFEECYQSATEENPDPALP